MTRGGGCATGDLSLAAVSSNDAPRPPRRNESAGGERECVQPRSRPRGRPQGSSPLASRHFAILELLVLQQAWRVSRLGSIFSEVIRFLRVAINC